MSEQKHKFWSEMKLDELTDHVTQHIHSKLLESGGKGMRMAVRDILVDIACNKADYELLKERK